MCSHMWSMEEELIDPAAQGLTRLLKEPQSQAVGAQRLAAVLAALCIFSAFRFYLRKGRLRKKMARELKQRAAGEICSVQRVMHTSTQLEMWPT